MTVSNKVWSVFGGTAGAVLVFVIVLMHEAWGDDRYVLKGEALTQAVAEYDLQIDIQETEILFAESERVKEKHQAIKSKLKRAKEALKEKPKE